jgi:hypothetical protein
VLSFLRQYLIRPQEKNWAEDEHIYPIIEHPLLGFINDVDLRRPVVHIATRPVWPLATRTNMNANLLVNPPLQYHYEQVILHSPLIQ